MEDCIFCKIIRGEIPSYTVYENETVKVFMDINPRTKGHLLAIPKKHYKDLMNIDDEILKEINEAIRIIYPKLKENLGCEGLTIMQNNELGQEVKHYHTHLIPRYKTDNFIAEVDETAKEMVEQIYKKLI